MIILDKSKAPLTNLSCLVEDMTRKEYMVSSFIFKYKHVEYIVLVTKAENKNVNGILVIANLLFMKSGDLEYKLSVEAGYRGLFIDAKSLRKYFGIEYQQNLGSILRQFTMRLGEFIPKMMNPQPTLKEKEIMVNYLSSKDSEDPAKVYCFGVKRNPGKGKRSSFNSNKTMLLRPDLFRYFQADKNISFCYTDNPNKEKSDEEILRDFNNKKF